MLSESSSLDSESRLFLRLLCGAPLPASVGPGTVDWRRFLRRASGGRVLYVVARSLRDELPALIPAPLKPILTNIVEEGDRRRAQFRNTLEHIGECLAGRMPYLIVKTARTLPYITFDVDLLVLPDDYQQAASLLIQSGGETQPYAPKKQSDILVPGLLRIDLHDNFHWQGSDFVDLKFLWENVSATSIEGIDCPTPNATVEWALIALNLLYERTYLPWLDFLALRQRQPANGSWTERDIIYAQARRHGWLQALLYLRRLLEEVQAACGLAWIAGAGIAGAGIAGAGNNRAGNRASNGQLGAARAMMNQADPRKARLPLSFSFTVLARLFHERWRRHGSIAWYDLAYSVFAKSRYHATRGQRFPIYGHWFGLSEVPRC